MDKIWNTSIGGVLLNIASLTEYFETPDLYSMWEQAYPNDPDTFDDICYLISEAMPHTLRCKPQQVGTVIQDARAVGLDDLADLFSHHLGLVCNQPSR